LTGALTLQEAAEELEELPAEQAAEVISQLDPQTAGKLLDELSTAFAAQIADELTILTLAEVLVNTAPEKAGAIMSLLSAETVTALINAIAEDALVNILPRMSLEKLFEIPLEVLFNRLPSVPAEQLAFEVPPQPDPSLPPPVKTQVSDVLTTYDVPDTGELVWARLVGSPAPIEKIFGRFARRLTDIQLEVEDLPGKPPEAPDLPSGSIVNAFFRIDVRNASPEDLQHAHLTLFVSKNWIKQNQVHDWSIQLNRFDPQLNIWVPFPTKRVLEDEERVFYTMVAPGFSVYALTGSVGLPPQTFEVTDLTIAPAVPSVAAPGQDVTVSARVRNLSNSRAVYPANLWVDRSIEAVQAVLLEGGETRTVSFTLRRSEIRTYRVRVERLLGEFAVGTQPLTPTPTPAPTVTPTSTQTATPTSTPARALTPAPPATLTPIATLTAPALAPTAQPQAQAATATPVPPTLLATATVAAPTPQPTATPTSEDGGGPNVGLIVGVIVGVVVAAGAGVTIFQLVRRRG
jgi:PGF-pre-PGF domain-containing protein